MDLSTIHATPLFEPHVTLLGGITDNRALAIRKTKELAAQLSAISATLTRIEFLEIYYRCLFFRTDDSHALMAAHQAAQTKFEHTNIHPFIPHISFLYGSLPIFQKQEIISELGDDFFMNFRMTNLRLVKTQRTPEYWELISEFEL